MKNILLIFGSMTSEHDLSCASAAYELKYIDREKFNPIAVGITKDGKWLYTEATPDEISDAKTWLESPTNRKAMLDIDNGSKQLYIFENDGSLRTVHIDCIFARIAGCTGEDGKLQGIFEMSGIPYVGCGVMSSAVTMDKEISYLFSDAVGIRRPITQSIMREAYAADSQAVIDSIVDGIVKKTGYPVFVKPASAGSSIGISKVHNFEELKPALDAAFEFDIKVLLEEAISGSEIKVGILGNEDPFIGCICKIDANGDFNDFNTKYIAHSSTKEIPAKLDSEIEQALKDAALAIFNIMDCRDLSRVDFFLTPENEIVFNEINTMPGFKPSSVYPAIMEASGVPYTELITRVLECALNR